MSPLRGQGTKVNNVFHCACRQESIDVVYHLERYFPSDGVSFHYFRTFEELLEASQRFALDLVIIAGASDFLTEIDLVRRIKENVFTSIVPTALCHPSPDDATVIAAYENGVDEFFIGPWQERLFEVRLRSLTKRSQRDISVNPSTMLPGPALIEREIERQLALDQEFAVCYTDLDNFKAYNDYYGYYFGDQIIRLTARIIRDTVFDLCREGFVGHIGGDDFIFIVPTDLVSPVCDAIIRVFDCIIPYRYTTDDRARGWIESHSRRGEIERFPFLSISVAVVVNRNRMFTHAAEMSRMLADLKKYVKSLPGSNYVVERRTKY